MRIILTGIVVLCMFSSYALCNFTDDPIRNAASARSLGMGMAFVAVADDASAPIFNPAGLNSVKNPQAMGMFYSRAYDTFNYNVFNGAYPTKYGTFGISGVYSGIDNITVTVPTTRSASYSDNLTILSYAQNLRKFVNLGKITRRIYVGTNLKIFQRGYTGTPAYSASGMNLDLGLKYAHNRWLTFGINKQNMLGGSLDWSTGESEFFPSPLYAGVAVKLMERKQTVAFDAEIPNDNVSPTLFHLGTEYLAMENFTLRGGLDQMIDATSEDRTYWNLSLGLGLNMGEGFLLDYAYHPYYGSPENASHFVTISYIGESRNKIKGKIKVSQYDSRVEEYIPE